MELLPNVHLLQVPIPESHLVYLNAYLFKTDEGSLLIDTGWNTDEAFGALARQLGEIGVSLSDLRYIVITHIHPDHFGLVGRLKGHTSAKVVMHEIERGYLEPRYIKPELLLEETDQWLRINGVPEANRPELKAASMAVLGLVSVSAVDYAVRGGEHIQLGDFDFEIVWTPGHSQGHICLYETKRRILVSGDHILPGITPNIAMHTQSMGNPLVDYFDSLEAVEELPVDLVLPAHREAFSNLPKRVREIRAHHEAREKHVLAALDGERKTAYQVAAGIPWATKGVPFEDLEPQPKRGAVMETLAHLELLRACGTLRKTSKDGLLWYSVRQQAV